MTAEKSTTDETTNKIITENSLLNNYNYQTEIANNNNNNEININPDDYMTIPIKTFNKIINISDLNNEEWINTLLSKETKWMTKRDIIEELTKNLINTNTNITDISSIPNYDQFFSCLKILLKDSNVNVVQSSINLVKALSTKLYKLFASYAREYIPLILSKFKEKKDKLNKDIINALSTMLKNSITFK